MSRSAAPGPSSHKRASELERKAGEAASAAASTFLVSSVRVGTAGQPGGEGDPEPRSRPASVCDEVGRRRDAVQAAGPSAFRSWVVHVDTGGD